MSQEPTLPETDLVREKIRALTATIDSGSPSLTAAPKASLGEGASFGGLGLRLRTLAVFRGLLADPVFQKLLTYLDVRLNNAPLHACLAAYGDFVAALYDAGYTALASYVQAAVASDENALTRATGRGEEPAAVLVQSAAVELRTLQALADLTSAALRGGLAWSGPLPEFETVAVDIAAGFTERLGLASRFGADKEGPEGQRSSC